MGNCRDIEPQLVGYVDGEIDAAERSRVETHLQRCPPCRGRVATERATHDLLASRREELRGCAPEALRHRCAAQCAVAAGRARFRRLLGSRALVPLSLAATLLLAAALFLTFGWSSGVETYAAQLADDHVRCFQIPPKPGAVDPIALAGAWQSANGWQLQVPPSSDAEDLQLLAVRRCGSSRGDVAHILYRWQGQPLSVYVLNGIVDDAVGGSGDLDVHDTRAKLEEHAVIWSSKGQTYAVVARGDVPEIERVARYLRRAVE